MSGLNQPEIKYNLTEKTFKSQLDTFAFKLKYIHCLSEFNEITYFALKIFHLIFMISIILYI